MWKWRGDPDKTLAIFSTRASASFDVNLSRIGPNHGLAELAVPCRKSRLPLKSQPKRRTSRVPRCREGLTELAPDVCKFPNELQSKLLESS